MQQVFTLLTERISLWDYKMLSDRLLQPVHVGSEGGRGGAQRAGEDEISCRGTADGPVSWHMDAGGVPMVHLPLCGRSPH